MMQQDALFFFVVSVLKKRKSQSLLSPRNEDIFSSSASSFLSSSIENIARAYFLIAHGIVHIHPLEFRWFVWFLCTLNTIFIQIFITHQIYGEHRWKTVLFDQCLTRTLDGELYQKTRGMFYRLFCWFEMKLVSRKKHSDRESWRLDTNGARANSFSLSTILPSCGQHCCLFYLLISGYAAAAAATDRSVFVSVSPFHCLLWLTFARALTRCGWPRCLCTWVCMYVCYAAVTRIQCTCLLLLARSHSRSLSFTHIPSLDLLFHYFLFYMWRLLCVALFIVCVYTNTNTPYLPLLMRCVCVQFVFFSITMCVWVGHTFYGWYFWSISVCLCVLFVVPMVPLLASDNRSYLLIASANSSNQTKTEQL